jgi:superfamily I DNA and/or RNA helicase
MWLKRLFPSFGCTLLSLGNAFPAETDLVRRMIIDEAGQCHSAYAISALLRARSALVIGDVHQLEPVIGLGVDDERRIRKGMKLKLSERELDPFRVFDESGSSAQSLADRAVPNRPTLRDHFRCQPAIVALCEAWCGYGMVARTRPSSLGHVFSPLDSAVLFQPVNGEQSRFAGSWQNEAEVFQVLSWVRRLVGAGVLPADVAVITPYRGQFEAIFRALRAHGVPTERPIAEEPEQESLGLFDGQGGVAVGTVHRFQGGERRVVLLSTTVTRTASLGFLNDRVHLLNVAASRAKDHLIVIGHEPTLRAGARTRILVDGQRKLLPLQDGGIAR